MHHSKHQNRQEHSFKDPVCGMEVSRSTAPAEYDYQGQTFFFCAPSCKDAFEADPEKYLQRRRHHRHE